jgi:DNA cross-link repair 1A protein
VVDLFSPREGARVKGSNGVWILTHFHADHYKGLSKKFSLGRILCSPITAQLVNTKLKVLLGLVAECRFS